MARPSFTFDHFTKPLKEDKQKYTLIALAIFFIVLRVFSYFFVPDPPPRPLPPTPTPTPTATATPKDREMHIRQLWQSVYKRTPTTAEINGQARELDFLQRFVAAKKQSEAQKQLFEQVEQIEQILGPTPAPRELPAPEYEANYEDDIPAAPSGSGTIVDY